MSDAVPNDLSESIAIVGMSGRFPGAPNVRQFWENIRQGVESISRFTDEELLAAGVELAEIKSPSYVRAGAVIEGAELFDAGFFGYSPREAESMDPQHRLFLEHAWEALESAGYDPTNCPGSVGVFAGSSPSSYLMFNLCGGGRAALANDIRAVLGNNLDFLATRVSYKLNLKGPSVVVQSSCSTSLVAVHLACQSLLDYQADMALAGGVSVNVPLRVGYHYQQDGIYSPDGRCRAFDADARGTVGGNGVGVVVLKRLADALADGDPICAVIRGSAINNDGSDKIGYSAPSVSGQAEVILAAQAVANVDPSTIGYVETHGTGTSLGDPIEIAALSKAFRAGTDKKRYCAIGSLKTNIGHLDAAAGVAGLIKAALSIQHATLPPSLNFERPNPEIDFESSPFFVNTKATTWESEDRPRRAGVSSFGMGGTNAHVILEQAPVQQSASSARASQLLVLSARTSAALDKAAGNLAEHLQSQPDINLADVAYTLQTGRKRFSHRRVVVGGDAAEAMAALEQSDPNRVVSMESDHLTTPVVFMFPGQGSQYVNMGAELYQAEPDFRATVDHCCRLLLDNNGPDLRHVIMRDGSAEEVRLQLKQTSHAQPALFVVEYALAQLLISWGIRPQAMIGHSIGEFVAACLAGVFTLEDALAVVAARGKLMQEIPAGAMLSVPLSADAIREQLGGGLSLAAVNSPRSCVVSGADAAVAELENRLASREVAFRRLETSHAFHSAMMDPILDPFTELVAKVQRRAPQIPFVSNLSGDWITEREATDPGYWARHLRETVGFSDGIARVIQERDGALLEVGPGRALCTFARQQAGATAGRSIIPSMPHPQDSTSESATLMRALGQLWLAGADIDWKSFHKGQHRRRLSLPTYPFERRRYWVDPQPAAHSAPSSAAKKANVSEWFYLPSWKRSDLVGDGQRDLSHDRWVVFADPGGVGSQVVRRLEHASADVIVVQRGDRFQRLDDRTYALNPAEASDYRRLVAELTERGRLPDRFAHLWSTGFTEGQDQREEHAQDVQDATFYSLLNLAQSLGLQDRQVPVMIRMVTAGTMEVRGDELLWPEMATVGGACKVIPQECPVVHCQQIDVELAAAVDENGLADQLFSELSATITDAVVAYRGKHRWTPAFQSFPVDPPTGIPPLLREEGVYLITGGLGAIGLEVADYLARRVRARLVLTTRSDYPNRDRWDSLLDQQGEKTLLGLQLAKLKSIEASGAQVLIVQADVADAAQMQRAIQQAERQFGALNGVIHAAGSAKDTKILQQVDRDFCEDQLRPKIEGLKTLSKLLADKPLDFSLVQSSLSSVLGALGFIAYTAAHQFVDVFVQKHNRGSRYPWISVNWDNWLNWKDPAMVVSAGETGRFMTAAEGAQALDRIFSLRGVSQMIVSTCDLTARAESWLKPRSSAAAAPPDQGESGKGLYQRPEVSSEFISAEGETERFLADLWGEVLGIEKIGVHDSFFELGGDSILAIQVVAKAAAAGIRITLGQIFQHPTVAQLSKVAESVLADRTDQEPVTGPAPLTPIQHWFFRQQLKNPHHFNLPGLFELPPGLHRDMVEMALTALVHHHDALRLRYDLKTERIVQENRPPEAVAVAHVDLSTIPAAELEAAIRQRAAEVQASLNISQGPVMRAVLFTLGANKSSRLLWVVHHLVIDVVSWRILLEDLRTACSQLLRGEKVKLPRKTTSFREWAMHLQEYASSAAIEVEADYWISLTQTSVAALPLDFSGGENLEGSARTVSVQLNEEDTRSLLTELPRLYQTQINDVLLASFAAAFGNWTGEGRLLVDVEMHGREEIAEGVDLSRSVGWFTAISPLLLDVCATADAQARLRSVKKQLGRLRQRGVGYGVLRYLSAGGDVAERVRQLPAAEVGFLYMGQFDGSQSDAKQVQMLDADLGSSVGPTEVRSHLLQVACYVRENVFKVDWIYSEHLHQRETIEKLATAFCDGIREMIGRDRQGVVTAPRAKQVVASRKLTTRPATVEIYKPTDFSGFAKPPLMIVPGMLGYVQEWQEFFRGMDFDRPVYGIELAGTEPFGMENPTLEQIAAEMVGLLEKQAGGKPFHLIGHSYGGFLAYEIGQQLHRRNAGPLSVILLDTHPAVLKRPLRPRDILSMCLNAPRWLFNELSVYGPVDLWNRIRRRYSLPAQKSLPDVHDVVDGEKQCVRSLELVFDFNVLPKMYRERSLQAYNAGAKYEQRPTKNRIVYLHSRVRSLFHRHLPDGGWGEFAAADLLIVRTIPGDHGRPLSMRWRNELAKILLSCLKEVDEAGAVACDVVVSTEPHVPYRV